MLLVVLAPISALADSADGQPELTPQPVSVDAGTEFDLEVSVEAWVDSRYTLTFANRTRFRFPGPRFETHEMISSDAILFRVRCSVESDAPDGDFPIAFKLTWTDNNATREIESNVTVTVGEGSGTDSFPCEAMVMVGSVSMLAFTVAIVGNRGRRRDRR